MVKKKLIAVASSATLLSLLAFSGSALAENTVGMDVDNEGVQENSECAKAGGETLTFDSGSVLAEGQQIRMDLDFGVTLCEDIDLVLSPVGDVNGTSWTGTGWGEAAPIPTSSAAVVQSQAGAANATGDGIFFRLRGNAGSQSMRLSFMGGDGDNTNDNDRLTVNGTTSDDYLTVAFLHQRTNAILDNDSIWTEGSDSDSIYDDNATVADNTLCIDVSDPDAPDTVSLNMNSSPDIYTFDPSNPVIAHVLTASDYSMDTCDAGKGANTGNFNVPGTQAACEDVDYETADGYCDSSSFEGNNIILETNDEFENVNYQISVEIISPSEGAYFSNDALQVASYDSNDEGCDDVTANNNLGAQSSYTYQDADGAELDAADIPATSASCALDSDEKATYFETNSASIPNIVGGDNAIKLNLPSIIVDDDISSGDELEVRVTLKEAPCTVLLSETEVLGTAGCGAAASLTGYAQFGNGSESNGYVADWDSTNNQLVYAYFPGTNGPWWNGLVVTNTTSSSTTVKLTIYEKDGTIAEMNLSLSPNETVVKLLSSLYSQFTITTDGDDGELGEAAYIIGEVQ